MKVDISCEVEVKEATIDFGYGDKDPGRLQFKANVYLMNNSHLRTQNPVVFNVPLDPEIANMIRKKIETEAARSILASD